MQTLHNLVNIHTHTHVINLHIPSEKNLYSRFLICVYAHMKFSHFTGSKRRKIPNEKKAASESERE